MNDWKHVYKKNLLTNQYILVGVINDKGILLLDAPHYDLRENYVEEYSTEWYVTDIDRQFLVVNSPQKINWYNILFDNKDLDKDYEYQEVFSYSDNSIGCKYMEDIVYFYQYEK